MAAVDDLKKFFKGKGTVKNHSSKTLWVVESTTNDPSGPAIAHQLAPHRKSPPDIDVDGLPIYEHSSWWKIYDYTTADVYNYGDDLSINVSIMKRVPENEFGKAKYDPSEGWGKLMKYVTDAEKGKTGAIERYFIEEMGWLSKAKAVVLAEQGQIDNAVIVRPSKGQPYLRSRPDHKKSNNFAEMAKT